MDEKSELVPGPGWFPLTPRGVAAAANASWGSILWRALLTATAVAFVCFCALIVQLFPVVTAFVEQLPDGLSLSQGRLTIPPGAEAIVAEDSAISFGLALPGQAPPGQTADLRLTFFPDRLRSCSLLGCGAISYPAAQWNWKRTEHLPVWQAWRPFIAIGFGVVVAVILWGGWWLIGALHAFPVMLAGYFLDRRLSFAAAWRVGMAALLPGGILLALLLTLHAIGALDLLQAAIGLAGHLVIAWFYLASAPFFLERLAPPRKNPFT